MGEMDNNNLPFYANKVQGRLPCLVYTSAHVIPFPQVSSVEDHGLSPLNINRTCLRADILSPPFTRHTFPPQEIGMVFCSVKNVVVCFFWAKSEPGKKAVTGVFHRSQLFFYGCTEQGLLIRKLCRLVRSFTWDLVVWRLGLKANPGRETRRL